MPWLRLPDGTVAHVRMGKRGAKITQRDIEAIQAMKTALDNEKTNGEPNAEVKPHQTPR
jgi:hypothetical protein